MYNANKPSIDDLPSSGQLVKSTVIALAIAIVILATAVLPAEYGIDPTGVGRVLGLTQMGDIKTQLADEAMAEKNVGESAPAAVDSPAPAAVDSPPPPPVEPVAAEAPKASVAQAEAVTEQVPEAVVRRDAMTLRLTPGQAAEIKVEMLKGTKLAYQWTANGGRVNYDTHGDPYNPPADFYHGYGKGRGAPKDEGTLEAAFDGKHGWFWRNRTNEDVTVTLRVEGDYITIKRVF